MIRKRVGDEFWLITQPDHARLAAELARAVGNRAFARPADPEAVYAAVAAHDDGWAAHDLAPTLDPAGLPTDVFDAPRAIAHDAWLASALAASSLGPYAGLLVSLHQLALSAIAASTGPADRIDDEQRRRQFDLNKIQHALIEHAEGLRARLGLVVDRPLRLGLADGWTDPAEERLKSDLRLLQAADALSLHVCCDHVPPVVVAQLHPRPGAGATTLRVDVAHDGGLRVRPWPFGDAVLHVHVPYRAIPVRAHDTVGHFREAVAAATVRTAVAELRAG